MAIKLLFLSSCIVFTLFSCKKQESDTNTNTQTTTIENQLREGLIAYYPFNNNANDESGNNYHLTVKEATLTSNRFDEPSKAYNFNGTNAVMAIPKLLKADSLRQLTISVWVKTELLKNDCILSFLPKDQIYCSYLLGFENNSNNNTFRTYHKMVAASSANNCISSIISDSITNPFDKWSHLVLVQRYYSNNNSLPRNDYFQYFNGKKLKVSSTGTGSNTSATSFSRGGSIGCNNTTGNNNLIEQFFCNHTCGNQTNRKSSAKMSATSEILMSTVFFACYKICVTRPGKGSLLSIVCTACIVIFKKYGYGSTSGFVVK